MERLADLIEESNRAGKSFLRTELDMALTFLKVANTTRDNTTAARNRDNAREAYRCVLHYQGRLRFAEDEIVSFAEKVAEVKLALLAVGFAV